MEMDAAGARNRGKKGRSDPGRLAGGRASAADAIQKAISGTTDSQANIRQTGKGNLEQVSVRGWKQSKAASNRDGGHESLITFLEKKLNTSDSKAGSRARITKVCATSELAVTDMNLRLGPLRCVPFSKMELRSDDRHSLGFLALVPLGDLCGFFFFFFFSNKVLYALLTFN